MASFLGNNVIQKNDFRSEEFRIDAHGRNMSEAFYSCMKLLSKRPGWEYMLLILNWDVVIKSPYEIVEIYKILGGANDVRLESGWNWFNHNLKWDARSLKLFLDGQFQLIKSFHNIHYFTMNGVLEQTNALAGLVIRH